jgi:hypothetical protein
MEAVNLKRTPPVTWEYVEILNRFQWKTRYSSTAVKDSNFQRQRLDTQCIQSYRCRYIATALSVPLQEFLHKFGTSDWIYWNADCGIAIAQGREELGQMISFNNI